MRPVVRPQTRAAAPNRLRNAVSVGSKSRTAAARRNLDVTFVKKIIDTYCIVYLITKQSLGISDFI